MGIRFLDSYEIMKGAVCSVSEVPWIGGIDVSSVSRNIAAVVLLVRNDGGSSGCCHYVYLLLIPNLSVSWIEKFRGAPGHALLCVVGAPERANDMVDEVLEPRDEVFFEYVLIVYAITKQGFGEEELGVLDRRHIQWLSEVNDLCICFINLILSYTCLQ